MADTIEKTTEPHQCLYPVYLPTLNLRKLVSPSGRTLHVAHSPEDQESLKDKLRLKTQENVVDICLQGSDDHIEAIRELYEHQIARKIDLRAKNQEIYDEVEELVVHLGHLHHELHNVTDRNISLDANYSKYGYDTHVRTKDASPSTPALFADSWPGANTRGKC